MAELVNINTGESNYWYNMFGNIPEQIDDTEEYEYVEYLESISNGSKPGPNQDRFVLYNRDIDPYLYFKKGFIYIRGYIAKESGIGTVGEAYYDGYEDDGQIAPCNVFNHGVFDLAELRLEGSLLQKVDNPRLIGLIKQLFRYVPDNESTQGTLSFFYKDTGDGGPSIDPVHVLPSLSGIVVTEDGTTNNYIKVGTQGVSGPTGGAQAGNNRDLLDNASIETGLKWKFYEKDNNDYNRGFVARRNRCITYEGERKKVLEMTLPLGDLFDFYNKNDMPFRGLKHEITLTKNRSPNTYLLRNNDTDDGIFVFEKISMCNDWMTILEIPITKPHILKIYK